MFKPFRKLIEKIKALFKNKKQILKKIDKYADEAIATLEWFKKNVVDTQLATFFVKFVTPKFPYDDMALEILKANIPNAIKTLHYIDDFNKCLEKSQDKGECIINRLREIAKDDKNKYYLELAKDIFLKRIARYGINISCEDAKKIISGIYEVKKISGKLAA